jgi:hypothetical protein
MTRAFHCLHSFSPIPPAPRAERISYGPRRVLGLSGIVRRAGSWCDLPRPLPGSQGASPGQEWQFLPLELEQNSNLLSQREPRLFLMPRALSL